MFIGYCNHYLDLKRQRPHGYKGYGFLWSLKEYGSLFVYQHILDNRPDTTLEFGPGFNTFFSDKCAELGLNYIAVDKSNDELGIAENADRYNSAIDHRAKHGHQHVEGLLGSLDGAIPDHTVDLIISTSVIEHMQAEDMALTATEARRLLRPGGQLVNSVDIYKGSKRHLEWLEACTAAGFVDQHPNDFEWRFSGERTTFMESQEIRYMIYNSLAHKNPLEAEVPYLSQFATVLQVATAP